jgi:hypothetical protein
MYCVSRSSIYNRSYFLVGAKIEYLFYLLQAKIKKITADYKSLTFIPLRDMNTSGFFLQKVK